MVLPGSGLEDEHPPSGTSEFLRDDGAADPRADHDGVVDGLRGRPVVDAPVHAAGEDHGRALAPVAADGSGGAQSNVGPACRPVEPGSGLASSTSMASRNRNIVCTASTSVAGEPSKA